MRILLRNGGGWIRSSRISASIHFQEPLTATISSTVTEAPAPAQVLGEGSLAVDLQLSSDEEEFMSVEVTVDKIMKIDDD